MQIIFLSIRNDPGGGIDIELNDTSEEDRGNIADILEGFKSRGSSPVNFKKENQRQLERITKKVNKILDAIQCTN